MRHEKWTLISRYHLLNVKAVCHGDLKPICNVVSRCWLLTAHCFWQYYNCAHMILHVIRSPVTNLQYIWRWTTRHSPCDIWISEEATGNKHSVVNRWRERVAGVQEHPSGLEYTEHICSICGFNQKSCCYAHYPLNAQEYTIFRRKKLKNSNMFSAEGLNLLDATPFNTQPPPLPAKKITQKDVSGFLAFNTVVTN